MPPFLTALFQRRTWREFGWALLALPLGVLGFVFTVTTVSVSLGLLVTFVGLPLLALTGVGARLIGSGIRQLSNAALGTHVPPVPAVRQRTPGLLGWLRAHVLSADAWRARLYLVLKLPLGILQFTTAVAFYSYGLGGVTYWFWRPFLPCQEGTDGECHRGANFGQSYFLDTPARITVAFVVGVVVLLVAPWVVLATVTLDRLAVQGLLGPTAGALRVQELERTRAVAVDDSAATLRRVERDLHDGTQARLVAIGMNVGLAREKLAEGADPAEAARLLDAAHTTAKDAITELRDLVLGFHPPVLEAGLGTALQTLAAGSAVPTKVDVLLPHRPAASVETIAYFCAAELLTNVAKHSGARSARIDVRGSESRLLLVVSDDGHGGAVIGGGSGLRGLSERVSTVDGRLSVDSPAGGPTIVSVDLPMRSG